MKKRKINPLIYWLCLPLGLLLAYKVWQMIKGAKNIGKDVGNAIKNDVTGQEVAAALSANNLDPSRGQAIVSICDDIYSAFYKDSFWGFGEDEEKAIGAFNSLRSTAEAKAAAAIYKANFKKILYTDMYKYCNGDHYKQITQSLLNATR